MVDSVRIEDVRDEILKIAEVLDREVVVFGSVVKNCAVKNESALDLAVKGKLLPKERDGVYNRFAKRIYEKYGLVLILHEIPEGYWNTSLKDVGRYEPVRKP